MALSKFIPTSPDESIKTDSDLATARFGHLNSLVDDINSELEFGIKENVPLLTVKSEITIPTGRAWDDGSVYKNTAAVRSEDGNAVYIIDITDSSNPVLASTLAGETAPEVFEDGILYTYSSGNLKAWDMGNPYSPVLASSQPTPISVISEKNYKFGNLYFFESSVESIYVFDVSNPYNIKYVTELETNTNFTGDHGFAVSNDYAFIWGTNNFYKLWRINWSDLTFTEILSSSDPFPGSGLSGTLGIVSGGASRFHCVCNPGGDKLATIDVVNDTLVLKGVSDLIAANGPGDNIKSFGEYVAVTSRNGYVILYDVSNATQHIHKQTLDVRSYATNMRSINGDANKIVLGSRNSTADIIILETNFYKAGVLMTGELVAKELNSDKISAIGVGAKTLGGENGGFGNLRVSKKFLYPKYTTAERTALTAEAGEAVYDTDTNKLYVYDGTTWQAVW